MTPKLDIKSTIVGIVATVIAGLVIQYVLTYFSDKPNTQIEVEYYPLFVPSEVGKLRDISEFYFADRVLRKLNSSVRG